MNVTQTAAAAPPAPQRRSRVWRIVFWALLIVVIGAAADLLGWDIRGWFENLWDTITQISAAYLVAGGRAQDRPDDADRVRLVRDPPLRLPDDELQGRARLLRDLGGAERVPAGEHRHAS